MNVLALAGGVGGGRMADGFYRCLGDAVSQLTVVVNTGDDVVMHGLQICPDLDSVTYTLSGLGDAVQGWGIAGDTHTVNEWIGRLGGANWFLLGDRDFAVHIQRTAWLREGKRLTEATGLLTRALEIKASLLPMCDEPVATRLLTDQGELEFQDYFVKHRQQPEVHGMRFEGIEQARVTPEVAAAWQAADLILVCPSNPFVSIDPILAVPGMRQRLAQPGKLRVAVSPIIAGQAVKGPAARMLASLGHAVDVEGIARIYAGLIDVLVIDEQDQAYKPALEALGLRVLSCPTWMRQPDDRQRLATEILKFVGKTVAVVPLNWLHLAKTRLADTSADRPGLVWDMLVNVVGALVSSTAVAEVCVVTPQLDLEESILALGASFLTESGKGLLPALEAGRNWAASRSADGLLVVLGDLPWLTTAEVDALLALAPARGVVLAPDRERLGTNALFTRPITAMPFHFGESSFPQHLASARAGGLELAIYESRGTRSDIDLPSQLEELTWKPV